MNNSLSTRTLFSEKIKTRSYLVYSFLFGLLLPLSFAPFHLPGAAILSLALFYFQLSNNPFSGFLSGLFFGLGYFGLGTSWVYVSIHEYGHLNAFLSVLITIVFVFYLSLFPATVAYLFKRLQCSRFHIGACCLFASLWVLFEYLRSVLFSGFPWLLIGFGQLDTPSHSLFPIFGVYGVSLWTCFASALLASSFEMQKKLPNVYRLALFVFLLLSPNLLQHNTWFQERPKPLSAAIIQANLSMRDKWDEDLFEQILAYYTLNIEKSLGTQIIVMPESAIPLPSNYLKHVIDDIHQKATDSGSAILLGIPKPTSYQNSYFNALISLGLAKGSYLKQHLVPFGEYIPKAMQKISRMLSLPEANLIPGKKRQRLIQVQNHSIASLICYELAYDELLRKQLPQAEWIVSISDAGWFGRSLALYQQQQMAQVRSLESGRYQVLANNDGLSSVINSRGEIVASLPAFTAGTLNATLFPSTGVTPWVRWGSQPVLIFSKLIVGIYCVYWILGKLLLRNRRGVILTNPTYKND